MSDALNPRYVAYAREHGREPADMLEHDRERWPGGSMCGFILWSRERLAEFGKSEAGKGAFYLGRLIDHAAYDAWLEARGQ